MTEQATTTLETTPTAPEAQHPGLPVQPGLPTGPPAPAAPVPDGVAADIADDSADDVVEATEAAAEPDVAVEPVTAAEPAAAPAAGIPTTRPAVASRKAGRRASEGRKVTRYTLDLEAEMHLGLRLFAVTHACDASKVMRALLWLLMANTELPAGATLADLVLDEIFDEDED